MPSVRVCRNKKRLLNKSISSAPVVHYIPHLEMTQRTGGCQEERSKRTENSDSTSASGSRAHVVIRCPAALTNPDNPSGEPEKTTSDWFGRHHCLGRSIPYPRLIRLYCIAALRKYFVLSFISPSYAIGRKSSTLVGTIPTPQMQNASETHLTIPLICTRLRQRDRPARGFR